MPQKPDGPDRRSHHDARHDDDRPDPVARGEDVDDLPERDPGSRSGGDAEAAGSVEEREAVARDEDVFKR